MSNQPREHESKSTPPEHLLWNEDSAPVGSWQIDQPVQRAIDRVPKVDDIGSNVSSWLHKKVLAGGKPTRKVVDLLHGTWLGHPLHPMLTDVTIGAWVLAGYFDAMAQINGSDKAAWAGDRLIELGTVAAAPVALSGLADFTTVPKPSTKTATLHGLFNVVGVGLNIASIVARRSGRHKRGRRLSWTAFGATAVSGFLGGLMVYGQKVGVDHSEKVSGADDWTAVIDEEELSFDSPCKVEINGTGVLLYRDQDQVYAIGSICSHAAGNLEDGSIADGCVTCPLHDSVFSLRDGSIVHGPATRPQPAFETRIRDGKVEIRSADA